jgi:outer membrane protein
MRIWKVMMASTMAVSFAGVAAAQDLPMPSASGFDRVVGVGVVLLPDYEGSDDYTVAPAPLVQYKFDGERYVQVIGNKLFVNVVDHPNLEFGALGIYRLGRDDPDDSVVDLMRDVDDSFELGGFVGFKKRFNNDIRHRMNVHFDVTQDVTDGHEGLVAQLTGVYWQPVTKPFDIGFRANVTYASDDYMSSFFDVTASDSAASGLSTFNASSGFKDIGLAVMGLYHLSQNWHVGGTLFYKRLISDASDSPVVDDRGSEHQIIAGLAVLYSW